MLMASNIKALQISRQQLSIPGLPCTHHIYHSMFKTCQIVWMNVSTIKRWQVLEKLYVLEILKQYTYNHEH